MILHHTHAVMFQRELLYTGVTRARRDLEVFYHLQSAHKIGGSPFVQGITNQQIEGDIIEKKLNYFKAKVRGLEVQEAIKNGREIPADTIKPTIMTPEEVEKLLAPTTEGEQV